MDSAQGAIMMLFLAVSFHHGRPASHWLWQCDLYALQAGPSNEALLAALLCAWL
jgi:hypothetical protein